MSHLRSSITTLSNKDLIENTKNLTILNNIHCNCNNNYKICCNRLLNAKNFDLFLSVAKGESDINPHNVDFKTITTNTDEYPYNYVIHSNYQRNFTKPQSPCIKPLAIDQNYKKNGKYKKKCGYYNQCKCEPSSLRDKCECNDYQHVMSKLSTPKLDFNSTLKFSNLC